jgi:hypothetical protein
MTLYLPIVDKASKAGCFYVSIIGFLVLSQMAPKKKYTLEQMGRALDAVQKGEKVSIVHVYNG